MDVGSLPDGSAFMVLEYLEGQDLEDHATQRGPLPVVDAVDYVLEALQALALAHAAGIVHRDLKPSNLFLARQPDGTSIVKVLDFGISKLSPANGAVDGHKTATAAILGSPYYMAPEQARSARSVDARADIWAVGVILYRLLTGVQPLEGETLTELLLAIVQDEPRPMRELRPDLPEGLDAVVARCLRKKPDERYPNVAELAAALQPYGGAEASRAVQRISRRLSVEVSQNPPAPAASSSVALASSSGGMGTAGSWARSSGEAPREVHGSKGRVVAVGAAVLLIGALGVAGVLSLRGGHGTEARPTATIAAPPIPSVQPAVSAPPVVLDPPPNDAPLVVASASASAPAVAAAPPGGRSPLPAPAKPPAGSKPPPASSFDFLNQRN
jgi:serine/threonine-protein kinase